jgi:hypothetical protein
MFKFFPQGVLCFCYDYDYDFVTIMIIEQI